MKVNGNDIRIYDAKQLKVEIQPPSMSVPYEIVEKSLLPIETEQDIGLGHLKLSLLFRGKTRSDIVRAASMFISTMKTSCTLELDRYKGKFKAYMTSNDYEKMIVSNRYILNLEFDGYFFDEDVELDIDTDEKRQFTIYRTGSRTSPCTICVTAKENVVDFNITGFTENQITVQSMSKGQTLTIDGCEGLVIMDGKNAFDKIEMWDWPRISDQTDVSVSTDKVVMKIKYTPMWI